MGVAELKQRLAAILAADAAGYSRLMAADEHATVAALDAARSVFRTHVEANHGRVVDMAGDSVLAVFETAAGATTAALAIQQGLDAASEAVQVERRLRFRIGVHLGDVIEKSDGTVYGDGVNVAARLQGLSEPGGAMVSDAVKSALRGKLQASFEDRGEQSVKNIEEPVRVFAARAAKNPAAEDRQGADDTDVALPDKPSVAVLPFVNMSADPEQEFFSDGMTEDIITGLSRSPWLFVISRSSSFTYRGAAVDIKKVCRELGVRYVLEGSVRKITHRVRVTAQLIDGISGSHVFAERYDGHLDEIFELQDDITQKVVAATTTQIRSKMDWSTRRRGRLDTGVWELVMHGHKLMYQLTDESLKSAAEVFRNAIAADAICSEAQYGLASALFQAVWMGFIRDKAKAMSEAYEAVKRSLALDEQNEYAHWTAGTIELWYRRHADAVAEFERAIELNPNCSLAYGSLGTVLAYSHDSEGAIRNNHIAIRTDPKNPSIFFRYSWIALANYLDEHYEESVTWARKAVNRKPDWYMGYVLLAASLGQLGRIAEARDTIDGLVKVAPDATLAMVEALPFKRVEDATHLQDGLQKAGLPG